MVKNISMIGMSALAAGLGLLAAPAVTIAQDSVFVTSTGNVGIGTSSPTRPLEVARSGAVEIGLLNSSSTHAGGGAASPTSWFVHVDNDPNRTFKVSKTGTGGVEVTIDNRLDTNGATLRVDGSVQATNVVFSSSREQKKNFQSLDPQEVLSQVAKLPITKWRFKEGPGAVEHIGPMAEDFHAAFRLNPNDKTISLTDTSGVTLLAVQGLLQRVRELEAKNTELLERLQNMGKLEVRLADLERALAAAQLHR